MGSFIIPQKGKFLRKRYAIFSPIAAISAYICILPLILTDIFVTQFQWIYFGLHDIPRIKRRDYFAYDRYLLSKLNPVQKLNCYYCEYANGVIAYTKAVVNQMEIYSCAIKHIRTPLDHAHQAGFYERGKYE